MKTATAAITAALTLIAIATIAQITHAETTPAYENTQTWQEWVQTYKTLAELSKTGMNTTQYTQKLEQALEALQQRNYEKAQEIINQVKPQLQQLYNQKDSYVLTQNIKKYTTAATILTTPALTYYLLPRAYLMIWYKLKRKWIINTKQ